jgi:carboxypeptidase PM20D1
MRTNMKMLMRLLGSTIALIAGVVSIQTARFESVQAAVERVPQAEIARGAAERLAGSLRIATISPDNPEDFDAEKFSELHAYLERVFPRAHAELRQEKVAEHSLLYTWQGTDSSLKPILLVGHMDVVPVEPGTERSWQYEPFAGRIADGFIWGRGAIDNKSTVVGTLEAVEMLLAEGFRPRRTVHLAYGHDEEVGGKAGARAIAALLRSRGVELDMVLDEGGVIGDGVLPGLSEAVGLVGIAEKGFVSIELIARVAGGHSSLPPAQSAVGIVSAAVARLERSQMPARLEGPTREMFEHIGPRLPYPQRAIFANLWLTRPLVVRTLQRTPATNAMVRTTTATTMFQSGTKDNVLPSHARAVVNFRILPGDSIDAVVDHVRRTIDDDRVQVQTTGRFTAEPSAVSSTDSAAFRRLERAIRNTTPEVIVTPYLVVVVTDARYYSDLSPNVFRFLPLRLTARDLDRMHGANERLGIGEYETAIRTYRQLIINAANKEE